MWDRSSTGAGLLAELRRRKVFRVAAVYAAGTFAVLQVASIVVKPLGLPGWTMTLVIFLAALGFPIALLLAWAFDVTPEGVQRTVESGTDAGGADSEGADGGAPVGVPAWLGGRTLVLVVALVLLGIGIGTGWFLHPEAGGARGRQENFAAVTDSAGVAVGAQRSADAPASSVLDPHKIAVLPFRNLSGAEENEALALGVHDDLLTRLSRIHALKVISRTSVMEYRDTHKKIPEIAAELGVGTILEGGIQRAGSQVRINVQLIDARTDEHLWAETYDRGWAIDSLFAIQSEIAGRVAEALRATLTAGERASLASRPTTSAEAYELYARARDLSWRQDEERLAMRAIELARAAIAHDSTFASAWALLGMQHARIYWFSWDRTDGRLALARQAIDRALALDPDLAEAHVAMGYYEYWGHLAYDRALAEFGIAERSIPSDPDVASGIGYVRRRQGRMDDALTYLRLARELDPRRASTTRNIAETLQLMRRYDEAEVEYDRFLALEPADGFGRAFLSLLQLQRSGDVEAARAVLDRVGGLEASEGQSAGVKLQMEMMWRDYGAALRRLGESHDSIFNDDQFIYLPAELAYGEVYAAMGRREEAARHYDSARVRLERLSRVRPDDERVWSALGLAYAGLGRRADAVRAGRRGVELLPPEKEAWRGAYRLEDLARIYASVGETAEAVRALRELLSRPGELSIELLKIDPAWDPLREDPGFRALVAR